MPDAPHPAGPAAGLPLPRLDGAVALVTGASRGLGEAIARAFARQGAALALVARDGARLAALARDLEAAGSPGVLTVAADLTAPQAPQRLASAVRERFGRLTCLVNNAGRLGPRVLLVDYPDDEWELTLAVNVTAPFRLVKACLPLLRLPGGPGPAPSLINVSSGVGRVGRARWGAYAVSKFAIEGLTQVLAAEVSPEPSAGSPGLLVLALNPGPTRTAMRAEAYPEEDPATLPPPEEIAPVFVWAAGSPAARRHHGQSLDAQALLAAWRGEAP